MGAPICGWWVAAECQQQKWDEQVTSRDAVMEFNIQPQEQCYWEAKARNSALQLYALPTPAAEFVIAAPVLLASVRIRGQVSTAENGILSSKFVNFLRLPYKPPLTDVACVA